MKERKAVRTVAIMTFATLFSKFLGALRNALFSAPFGTGSEAVAFAAAQRIPLSFFDILFSAAITGCFIPAYNSFALNQNQNKKRESFTAAFFLAVVGMTGAMTAAGEIFAPKLVSFTVPNLDGDTHALAVLLLRIMFPSVIFIGGCYVLSGILQSRGSFILPALVSSGSNLLATIYLLFCGSLSKRTAILYLAVIYTASWAVQFLTLLVPLIYRRGLSRTRPDFTMAEFRNTVAGIPAAALGAWLNPAALLIGTFFASISTTDGGASVFDYSYNIYIIAAGVLSHGISGFIFPTLSRLAHFDSGAEFSTAVKKALYCSLFISLPFSMLFFILSGEAVSVLYLRDSFTVTDATAVFRLLRVTVLSIPFYSAGEILLRVFYAKKRIGVPVTAAFAGVVFTVVITLMSQYFSGGSILSVGIGYGAGQLAAVAIMFLSLPSVGVFTVPRRLFTRISRIILPSALSAVMMLAVYSWVNGDPFISGTLKNISVSAAVFTAGTAPYLIQYLLTKLKKTRERRIGS